MDIPIREKTNLHIIILIMKAIKNNDNDVKKIKKTVSVFILTA